MMLAQGVARLIAALIVVAASLPATPGQARDLVLTRTAKSGADSVIAYERAWDHNCQPRASSVTFTSQPAHGTVSVVQAVSTIPASTPRSGSTGKCAGQSVTGNEIHYLSNPGFHGVDHVSWTAAYDIRSDLGGATTVSIIVK